MKVGHQEDLEKKAALFRENLKNIYEVIKCMVVTENIFFLTKRKGNEKPVYGFMARN